MKTRADVDNKFIRRFLFIAIGCFGFMLYGLYDGIFVYPKKYDKAVAYAELQKEVAEGQLSETEKSEKWNALCKSKNWGYSLPETPENAQNDIYFQWFVFGAGLVLGLGFLIHFLRLRGSWVEADGKTLTTSWGQELEFKNITSVNKSKWLKKGIAKVAYTDASGASKMIKFDDFKFNRESMGEIMKMAESHLSDDQIVGGIRETDSDNSEGESSTDEEG